MGEVDSNSKQMYLPLKEIIRNEIQNFNANMQLNKVLT